MSHVSNFFSNSSDNSKFFSVEVITFDGLSHSVNVEAPNAELAKEFAASQFDNVDLALVQCCTEDW